MQLISQHPMLKLDVFLLWTAFSRVTEEKISLREVHDLCYFLGLFFIFWPPNVIPRGSPEVSSENGQMILTY
jgi:hypothetical protein